MNEQIEVVDIPGNEATPPSDTGAETRSEAELAAAAAEAEVNGDLPETDEQKNARIAAEAAAKAADRQRRNQQSINQRFAELTAEKNAAMKMATELLELAKKNGTAAPAPTAQESGPPQRDQFESYEEYLVATTAWTSAQTTRSLLEENAAKEAKAREAEKAADAERIATENYAKRHAETAKAIPDFEEVMKTGDVKVPTNVALMIRKLDNGPLVAYHMMKNPALAEKFANTDPAMHGVILGQISASVTTPAKPSAAPAPGKPAGASVSVNSSNDPPEDTEAYFKWAAKNMRN